VDTINDIIKYVKSHHPNVVSYGEGWSMNTNLTKDVPLATQVNSPLTPGFAYFNDTIRDSLRGSTFDCDALGFLTGAVGIGDKLESCFRGLPFWCHDPRQNINYISCHDNNTLLDRITLARPDVTLEDRVRMYRLGAVFYMAAQGIPFMQAGEEMLRSKPNTRGGFVENSFKSPDRVNSIKWNLLEQPIYQNTLDYYKGLIAFRKAHPVLRLTSSYEILSHVVPVYCQHPHIGAFHINGNVPGETCQEMYIIFSAAKTAEVLPLPQGKWQLCINAEHAGTTPLETVEGTLTVPPLSAMVMIR
jgi:pullulanase